MSLLQALEYEAAAYSLNEKTELGKGLSSKMLVESSSILTHVGLHVTRNGAETHLNRGDQRSGESTSPVNGECRWLIMPKTGHEHHELATGQ